MTICTHCGKLGGHWRKGDECPSPRHPENRARRDAAALRERAEQIAREVWREHMLSGGSIQDMLTAAALAALTEKEGAR